jgi:ESX secretion-associated protein EspA/E
VKVVGELIERIAGRAGLENVREVGERLTQWDMSPAGGGADAVAGSDLLDFGQSVITGLKCATGRGDPERGEAFGRGQSTFTGVNETLRSAVPDNGWDGAGADAYADQNTRQQLRSEAMADADHEVHKVLSREAAQITLRRGYVDDVYNLLANTSHVAYPLQFIPRYGEAMKLAIEVAALQTALGESCHQMNQLQREVTQNAAALQQAVGRYSGVAEGADLPGAAISFDPRATERTHDGSASRDGESLGALAQADRDTYSERLRASVATRLDSENPPGPPAGPPMQDGR